MSFSKTDLYFLALVRSGAINLEPINPKKSSDGIDIYYKPDIDLLFKNLRNLEELHRKVSELVPSAEQCVDASKSRGS